MAKRFTRQEVIGGLKKTIDEGRPILAAGAGAGIIAKCIEIGGCDLIILYSTGKSRMMGLPTALIGDPNTVTLEMAYEILFVVKNTPVIAGIHCGDLTRDMDELLKKYKNLGFSGVFNFPSIGSSAKWIRDFSEAKGVGITREIDTMRMAQEMDMFTMSYAYRPEDARRLAPVVDALCAHCGWTTGGLTAKYRELGLLKSYEETAAFVQAVIKAAKDTNPDVICLAHGGIYATPEDVKHLYKYTDAVGYVAGSSVERIPVENALINITKKFRSLPVKRDKKELPKATWPE